MSRGARAPGASFLEGVGCYEFTKNNKRMVVELHLCPYPWDLMWCVVPQYSLTDYSLMVGPREGCDVFLVVCVCFLLCGPMGIAFSWRGCSLQTIPPVGRRSPLLRTWGYVILWENRGGSVGSTFDSGLMCCRFESHLWN